MLFAKAPHLKPTRTPVPNTPRKWFLKGEMTAFGNMPDTLIINLPSNRKIVLEENIVPCQYPSRR